MAMVSEQGCPRRHTPPSAVFGSLRPEFRSHAAENRVGELASAGGPRGAAHRVSQGHQIVTTSRVAEVPTAGRFRPNDVDRLQELWPKFTRTVTPDGGIRRNWNE